VGTPAGEVRTTCPYCQEELGPDTDAVACPDCTAKHHAECWEENSGCGMYGCTAAPSIEQRRPIETPVSFWGQEHKACPSCGNQIMATALRCRHCGTVFDVAQPQSVEEARRRDELKVTGPAARRMAIIVFTLCIVPLAAPLGVLIGLLWYPRRRAILGTQPALFGALARLGLGIGVVQTAFVVVMALLYGAFRTR
jgi:hypothetical protein